MLDRPSTYGRYCLPARQSAPLRAHPAYLPAMLAWLGADAVMVASHHGLVHASHGVQFALDMLVIVGVFGLMIFLARNAQTQSGSQV